MYAYLGSHHIFAIIVTPKSLWRHKSVIVHVTNKTMHIFSRVHGSWSPDSVLHMTNSTFNVSNQLITVIIEYGAWWYRALWDQQLLLLLFCTHVGRPVTRPVNGISIEFEIPSKFGVLWFSLTWRMQNFVLIGRIYYEQEHQKISLNSEFDRNIVSWPGARWPTPVRRSTCGATFFLFFVV